MDDTKRQSIPAELKRRVLVEAGHRCAIPTCRYIDVDIHHIIPWSTAQEHTYENLIALCPNCHRRADHGEIDRKSLRIYKSNLRYTHDRFSQFEVDVLFQLHSLRENPRTGLLFPSYMSLLINRINECGFIKWTHVKKDGPGLYVANVNVSPSVIQLTEKGIAYVDSLSIDHDHPKADS